MKSFKSSKKQVILKTETIHNIMRGNFQIEEDKINEMKIIKKGNSSGRDKKNKTVMILIGLLFLMENLKNPLTNIMI